jgi:hypothetical protein
MMGRARVLSRRKRDACTLAADRIPDWVSFISVYHGSRGRDPRLAFWTILEVVILDVFWSELKRLTSDDLSGGVDLIFTRPFAAGDRK